MGMLARHRVAPNMLMILMLIVGAWAISQMNIRFFPKFAVQTVMVKSVWEGAAAEDVEKSLITPLENELRNVDGLEKMTAVANDGAGILYLEFPENADIDKAADQVKQYADQAAGSLPDGAEAPEVQNIVVYDALMRIALTGDSPDELRRLARRLENELNALDVAKVNVRGIAKEEIQVRVPRGRLMELNTTARELGAAIAAQNRDASAGDVASGHSQRRLRALAKSENLFGLDSLPVGVGGGGDSQGGLRLGDIADIVRRPADRQKTQWFDGKPSVELQLQRRAGDNTLDSAERLHQWLENKQAEMPPGVELVAHDERWRLVQSRLYLLLDNGLEGLILVMLILFLFLNGRVAFWVAAGIPAVFFGTLFVMKLSGGSINMISMFALIMATGIIVDDAIVVGENAMHEFEKGKKPLDAAVDGALSMAAPVIASTLTTVASFLPLFVVGGIIGSIIYDIPFVIVCILFAAVFECFLILPGHLYHAFTGLEKAKPSGMRKKLNAAFDHFQEKQFRPLASLAIRYRAVTVAACLGLVIFSASLFAGGLVKYRFFPSAEGTIVNANIAFIAGTPPEAARAYANNLIAALKKTEAEFPDEENLIRHVKVNFGEGIGRSDDGPPSSGDEYAGIQIELSDPENRSARADQVAASWEKHAPRIAGLESLVIESQRGGPPGGDLAVRLQGEDLNNLKAAALEVREVFGGLPGVSLPDDDMPFGKPQIAFELSPLGRSLGLSTREVAAQLRDALDGYKAQTFYEGVDEIDVRVLMDGGDASGHLRSFPVRLPGGGFASLEDVADLRTRRGFDSITRIDGRAAVNVSGKVDFSVVDDLQGVIRSLRENELPDIAGRHGVDFSFEGQQADQKQTIADMKIGLAMAMVFIYIILTWVFASWSIPLVVMVTMPLGVIGAILGHWVMGAAMSILSFFGVFALMGIIVNDSIVLVKYFQEQRRLYPNMSADELILGSACRRLRAVVVTSLTTIAGLLPLMFETSTQAQFLIPMAISICFGLAFATALILLFTPACLSYHQSLIGLLPAGRPPADTKAPAYSKA